MNEPHPDTPPETVASQAHTLAGHPYELPFEPPASFVALFQVDARPYIDRVNAAIREMAALLRPETDPPLCRQELPAEGTE